MQQDPVKHYFRRFAGILCAMLFCLVDVYAQGAGQLRLQIDHRFLGSPLALHDSSYRSESGDTLFVDVLRYYISGIELMKDGKSVFREAQSHHLVDMEVPGSERLVLEGVPAGTYDMLRFLVGTDSLSNVSGANGGDLDPGLGMYWAWNSGYINVKLEGRSKACATLHHAFEFHIGGYMPPYPTARSVDLPLRGFHVRPKEPGDIRIRAELSQFFRSIRLDDMNQVMIPSKQAAKLADYFSAIFSPE